MINGVGSTSVLNMNVPEHEAPEQNAKKTNVDPTSVTDISVVEGEASEKNDKKTNEPIEISLSSVQSKSVDDIKDTTSIDTDSLSSSEIHRLINRRIVRMMLLAKSVIPESMLFAAKRLSPW